MADDDHADAEQQDERGSKDRQGQEQAAALDKMTDNVRAALLLCCILPHECLQAAVLSTSAC